MRYKPFTSQCSLFDPPENIRKPKVFWCFQGDQKGTLGSKGLSFSSNISDKYFAGRRKFAQRNICTAKICAIRFRLRVVRVGWNFLGQIFTNIKTFPLRQKQEHLFLRLIIFPKNGCFMYNKVFGLSFRHLFLKSNRKTGYVKLIRMQRCKPKLF